MGGTATRNPYALQRQIVIPCRAPSSPFAVLRRRCRRADRARRQLLHPGPRRHPGLAHPAQDRGASARCTTSPRAGDRRHHRRQHLRPPGPALDRRRPPARRHRGLPRLQRHHGRQSSPRGRPATGPAWTRSSAAGRRPRQPPVPRPAPRRRRHAPHDGGAAERNSTATGRGSGTASSARSRPARTPPSSTCSRGSTASSPTSAAGFTNVTTADPAHSSTTALYRDLFHFGLHGETILAETIGARVPGL